MIRTTYKNGVITPLENLNLPDAQEFDLEVKVLPSPITELSKEEKRNLNQKMTGSMKCTWEVVLKKSMITSSQKGKHGT